MTEEYRRTFQHENQISRWTHYQVNQDLSSLVLPGELHHLPSTQFWASPEQEWIAGYGYGTTIRIEQSNDRYQELQQRTRDWYEEHEFIQLHNKFDELELPVFIGGCSFQSESHLEGQSVFEDGTFIIPRIQIKFHDGTLRIFQLLTQNQTSSSIPVEKILNCLTHRASDQTTTAFLRKKDIEESGRIHDQSSWSHCVQEAINQMKCSQLNKVVLADRQKFTLSRTLNSVPTGLFTKFAETGSYFSFLNDPDQDTFLYGFPPERLVRRSGDIIRTESLAGTESAGSNVQERRQNARELVNSHKYQQEHQAVVQYLRRTLNPFVADLTSQSQIVRHVPGLLHLSTPLSGHLDENYHVLELVSALHPTPAVGGDPRQQALEFIEQHEPFGRDWYAGPIGYFGPEGNGDFSIAIRCSVFRSRKLEIGAGAGIIRKSDPQKEWDEINMKFQSIMDLLTLSPSSRTHNSTQ